MNSLVFFSKLKIKLYIYTWVNKYDDKKFILTTCYLKYYNMKDIKRAKKATSDEVDFFIKGSDPQEHIIKIECGYGDDYATVIWRDENYVKHYDKEPFYPFCWAKQEAGRLMFNGDRTMLRLKMQEYGIGVKALIVANEEGVVPERMANGYRNLWYATKPMSNHKFSKFFDLAKVPLKPTERDETYGKTLYKTVAPNEQFMIKTGKRLFKGYDSYDDIMRMQFDIETTGLEKSKDLIDQIGIRTNKGFEKIIQIDGDTTQAKIENGRKGINEMFDIIDELDPDVVSGYNSEAFDFEFYDVFLRERFGVEMVDETKRPSIPYGCYKKKKQSVLKLGGEMEYYYPTIMWGKHITDCKFSVRRAQALDSNMKKATLKYITKYSKINKGNRVYVNGKLINTIWSDFDDYALNETNGDWYKIDDNKKLKDGYDVVTGRYIVQRYLLDDLWETDKVELRYNETNFLVCKMLPVSFERMCTMGTATIWKYIMMAWSFERDLAIPLETNSRSFTGGLSRLLTVGYIPNVLKLDYNSLYPSIILSMGIKSEIDISEAMPSMLEYILTQRETFKALKGKYGNESKALLKQIDDLIKQGIDDVTLDNLLLRQEEAASLASKNDKMQLPMKTKANAYFGSFGSGGGIFPWSDIDCAEETTCCGRQMLRLMLKWFSDIGYQGIVCDSVTGDTPLFVKYNNSGLIDIKSIEELFDGEHCVTKSHGRQYDLLPKEYKVLCRSGWCEPSYFYRHETDKDVYRVDDGKSVVDVTKDHSLFNDRQEEIKPEQITEDTRLEYYKGESIFDKFNNITNGDAFIRTQASMVRNGKTDRLSVQTLNATLSEKRLFVDSVSDIDFSIDTHGKTLVAGIQYMKNCLQR